MAVIQSLSSGSPFIGSPITLQVKAKAIGDTTGTLAYHRLRLDVYAALIAANAADSDYDYTIQQMSTPSDDAEVHVIDVSSALRSVFDRYNYTSDTVTYPIIRWRVVAYDEYMINGIVYENQSESYFPGKDATPVKESAQSSDGYHSTDGYIYYHACAGKYDDLTRLRATADVNKIQILTTRPCSVSFATNLGRSVSPQIVALGETFVYAADLSTPQSFATLSSGNKSQYVTISKEGLQTIGGCSVYALPKDLSGDRYEFRFVNSRGVLESISFKSLRETEVNISSTEYVISQPETFREFSRAKVSKSQDYETWKMQTPPLDRAWHQWYIHEFLMAENVWINLNPPSPTAQSPTPLWVPCLILPEDTVTGMDRNGAKALTCEFSVRIGLNGTTMV